MASQLGGPVLLKQGYLQIKTAFGWKRQYYRLLQVASRLMAADACVFLRASPTPPRSPARLTPPCVRVARMSAGFALLIQLARIEDAYR